MIIKRLILCIIVILLWGDNLNGQALDTLWTRTIGGPRIEKAQCIRQTSDGGFIIAGIYSFSTGHSSGDVLLVKTDSNCDTTWTKTYVNEEQDRIYSIIQISDGGYICTGYHYYPGGDYDILILRMDSEGDTAWTRFYGTDVWEQSFCIEEATDSSYVVVGNKAVYNSGLNIYLMCIGPGGDTLWTKTYDAPGYNFGYSVKRCSDGGFIIAGRIGAGSEGFDVCCSTSDKSGNMGVLS